ncbi:MAG: hypothetical protein A2682_02330 [Candidatus Terrybacteria bacterium RIFCSPHIGHO2_01_FULL_58_15]|uniref:Uncharacterized protein n=1 Tax=Terrybacteria sp. (strain RIFCSPHIGHO2_01_FULL_58_15) TaxID=1802363 RepID=A0A1G2PIQ6_TERXR|nr:MAG: hypothetical protein A2682_02330 [Candidatus Terrybacteria bacterium RIFCSPHIGHO2_01_FULL_58_15]
MPFVPRKRVIRELERYEKERPSFTKRELKRVTKPLTGEFRQRAVGRIVSRKEFREGVHHAVEEQKIRGAERARLFERWRKWFRPESLPPMSSERDADLQKRGPESRDAGYGVPVPEPPRVHVPPLIERRFDAAQTGSVIPPELRGDVRDSHDDEQGAFSDDRRERRDEETALRQEPPEFPGTEAPLADSGSPRALPQRLRERFSQFVSARDEQEGSSAEEQAPRSTRPEMTPAPQSSVSPRESDAARGEEMPVAGLSQELRASMKPEALLFGEKQGEKTMPEAHRSIGAIPSHALYERKRELSEMIASGETLSPQREARSRRVAAGVQFQARIEGWTFWRRAAWWGFLGVGAFLWLRELVFFSSWWGIPGTFVAAVLGPILIPFFPILEWFQRGGFPWLDFALLVAAMVLLWYGRWESQRFLRSVFPHKFSGERSTPPPSSDSMDPGRR